jgi:hypothetical protein
MNKNFTIGIIGVAIVIGATLLWTAPKNSATQNNTVTPGTGMMVEQNSIAASAQAGSQNIDASMVMLTKPGFVVVHEDKNGQPGAVIGSSKLIQPGMVQMNIPLSRKTVKGEILYAMLHFDNGDGVYSDADQPVLGKNGSPIMMNITVGAEGSATPAAVSL